MELFAVDISLETAWTAIAGLCSTGGLGYGINWVYARVKDMLAET